MLNYYVIDLMSGAVFALILVWIVLALRRCRAEDVDEALRLVYMSKASVLESEEPSNRREDVLSVVYAVVRELFVGKGVDVMDVGEVERFVMRKGFSQIQLEVRDGGEMHCRSVFSTTRILMCGCSQMIILDWRLFGVFVRISIL